MFFNFKVDEQSPQLYHLTDLTRCAAIYNCIITCGNKQTQTDTNEIFSQYRNNINLNIMQIFMTNFEQFFAMCFHARFGNILKLAMMRLNKVLVAVFNHDGMVFMYYSIIKAIGTLFSKTKFYTFFIFRIGPILLKK